jgi:hypothetical protein
MQLNRRRERIGSASRTGTAKANLFAAIKDSLQNPKRGRVLLAQNHVGAYKKGRVHALRR